MIAATLSGPSYFSPNHDEHNIEVFATLQDVIEALLNRYAANGQYELAYTTLDGVEHSTRFPSFDVGTTFTCYLLGVNYQSPALRQDEVDEVLTAVHNHGWEYTVTLDGQAGIAVAVVEKAGIS